MQRFEEGREDGSGEDVEGGSVRHTVCIVARTVEGVAVWRCRIDRSNVLTNVVHPNVVSSFALGLQFATLLH